LDETKDFLELLDDWLTDLIFKLLRRPLLGENGDLGEGIYFF
jgi:hypothetical protein